MGFFKTETISYSCPYCPSLTHIGFSTYWIYLEGTLSGINMSEYTKKYNWKTIRKWDLFLNEKKMTQVESVIIFFLKVWCILFSIEQSNLIFPFFSIQVFHCLKHEGTGGRTLLVDGFYAAEQVLQKAPEEFELLSKVPLKHEYIENVGECQNHMIGVGPVLNIYPWNKELYLIRWVPKNSPSM